jgi:hypothetical protein
MKSKKKKYMIPIIGLGALVILSAFKKRNMDKTDKIIKLAKLYEGIEEIGDNAGFNNAVLQDMLAKVGWNNSEQWCMYFAKAIYDYSLPDLAEDFNKSLNGSSQRSFNNVQAGKSKNLRVVTSGRSIPGDIVIWVNKSDSSKGHAGIVIETGNGNYFKAIEGNTNYQPAYSGQNELVDIVPHNTAIGETDNVYTSKKLRGFIRLV